MCDSNDVKFTGKVCGLDEPIQCVSIRPPLAHIRPNWLRSIHVLAVYYLEEFLVASRPRLRVFPRRKSSFLPSQKPTFATSSNSVRSLARGYQCCTRRTTDTKVVLPIKTLITFYFFYVQKATFTNRQRESTHTKRLSETRSLMQQVLRFVLSCNGKEPLPKELLESEYVALLTLLLAVYLKKTHLNTETLKVKNFQNVGVICRHDKECFIYQNTEKYYSHTSTLSDILKR